MQRKKKTYFLHQQAPHCRWGMREGSKDRPVTWPRFMDKQDQHMQDNFLDLTTDFKTAVLLEQCFPPDFSSRLSKTTLINLKLLHVRSLILSSGSNLSMLLCSISLHALERHKLQGSLCFCLVSVIL